MAVDRADNRHRPQVPWLRLDQEKIFTLLNANKKSMALVWLGLPCGTFSRARRTTDSTTLESSGRSRAQALANRQVPPGPADGLRQRSRQGHLGEPARRLLLGAGPVLHHREHPLRHRKSAALHPLAGAQDRQPPARRHLRRRLRTTPARMAERERERERETKLSDYAPTPRTCANWRCRVRQIALPQTVGREVQREQDLHRLFLGGRGRIPRDLLPKNRETDGANRAPSRASSFKNCHHRHREGHGEAPAPDRRCTATPQGSNARHSRLATSWPSPGASDLGAQAVHHNTARGTCRCSSATSRSSHHREHEHRRHHNAEGCKDSSRCALYNVGEKRRHTKKSWTTGSRSASRGLRTSSSNKHASSSTCSATRRSSTTGPIGLSSTISPRAARRSSATGRLLWPGGGPDLSNWRTGKRSSCPRSDLRSGGHRRRICDEKAPPTQGDLGRGGLPEPGPAHRHVDQRRPHVREVPAYVLAPCSGSSRLLECSRRTSTRRPSRSATCTSPPSGLAWP